MTKAAVHHQRRRVSAGLANLRDRTNGHRQRPGSFQEDVIDLTSAQPETQRCATDASAHQRVYTRSQMKTKIILVLADLLAVTAALVLAHVFTTDLTGTTRSALGGPHLLLGLLSLPVSVVVFTRYRLYSARHVTSRLEELRRIIHAVGLVGVSIAVLGFSLNTYASRGWLILSVAFALCFVLVERELVRRVFDRLRRRGLHLRSVVMIGDNIEALSLCSMLEESPRLGYRVVGFVSDDHEPGSTLRGLPVLGDLDNAHIAVARSGATGVVIATTSIDLDGSNTLVRELTDAGIHVELSSSLRDIAAERVTIRPLGQFPMMYVEPVRRDGWRAVAKRAFDITVAAVALGIGVIPLLVVSAAIKLDSPGRIFFRQTRVGRDENLFDIFKFRTMTADAEARLSEIASQNECDGPLFKIRDDPRVTRVGLLLRKFSIDEVPQFWNVLRGEMSIVGPRPALASEAGHWSPALRNRLRAKPGITGMWQVSGRSDTDFDDYARLDLYYVDNWSLWTDLAIVAKTFPTVLLRKGAY